MPVHRGSHPETSRENPQRTGNHPPYGESPPWLIAMVGSAGRIQAMRTILAALPPDLPAAKHQRDDVRPKTGPFCAMTVRVGARPQALTRVRRIGALTAARGGSAPGPAGIRRRGSRLSAGRTCSDLLGQVYASPGCHDRGRDHGLCGSDRR